MDVIHALAARYCVRQDARGFVEVLALAIALGASAIAILRSVQRGIGDRSHRLAALFGAGALAGLLALTIWFALTIFRWCYVAAAPSLGMVPSDVPRDIDAMVCLSPHAVEMIDGWIVIVVSWVVAIALFVLGIFHFKGALRRFLSFAGAGLVSLFAVANIGLFLFGISWCHSSRLF